MKVIALETVKSLFDEVTPILTKDKEYEVLYTNTKGNCYIIKDDEGIEAPYYTDRFKIKKEIKTKETEMSIMKVKCIKNDGLSTTGLPISTEIEIGKTYTVDVNKSGSLYWIKELETKFAKPYYFKEHFKMVTVNYNIFANSMVLNFDGKTITLNKSDARYAPILQAIKEDRLTDIPELVDISKVYNKGGLELKDNLLWLDGESLPDALSDRILAFQQDQLSFEYLIKFARKLRKNPSFNSREQLYKFLEHNGHPITKEGNFIAYRGVTEDFKDVHTKTFDNKPGSVCEMKREEVDDNPNNTCSRGLHVACYDYAKGFGSKLVEVEVDPQDVVCVPTDYNGTKMRTCKFKVVAVADKMNTNQLVDSSYEPDEFDVDNYASKSSVFRVNLKSSSFIQKAEYDQDTEVLTVTFSNGKTETYYDIEYDTIAAWELAESAGKYFNTYIKS